jgi:glycolate oxidase
MLFLTVDNKWPLAYIVGIMKKMNREAAARLEKIVGSRNFSMNPTDLALYSYDASNNPSRPDAVIHPSATSEVSQIMKTAWEYEFPVTPRGAGAGFTGGSVPVKGGLVLTTKRMNSIKEILPDDLIVITEPGVITEDLQQEVERYGLFYPPDPASKDFSTIGGNVAESAGGPRAFKYGVTSHYLLGLEAVLPDGTVINTGSRTIKNVVGYNLTSLIAGSEGTLAIITSITLRLIPKPPLTKTIQLLYADVESAARTISSIIASKVVPTTMEIMDDYCVELANKHASAGLPNGVHSVIIIECDGTKDEVEREIEKVVEIAKKEGSVRILTAESSEEAEALWKVRRSLSPIIAKLWDVKVNEDIVVPRSRIPETMKFINNLQKKYRLDIPTFGHAGDGNLHVNIMYNKRDTGADNRAKETVRELFEFVVSINGSISGEHGIGITKAPFLKIELTENEILLLKRIKAAFDPKGILNPGKIFD